MTNNYYTTGNYKPDYSTFGGKVYNYDFDGYNSMADIAKRIASDLKFDEQCRKNVKNKYRKEFINTYGK